MLVTREIAKVGMIIYSCWDDTQFDGYGYSKGVIREVHKDHFLYDEDHNKIKYIWGSYDKDENVSSVVFTSFEDVQRWFKKRNLQIINQIGGCL